MMMQQVSKGHRRGWYCVRILGMAVLMLGASLTAATGSADTGDVVHDPFLGAMFPTVNKTGLDICTTDDGKPVIFLFSTASCSHCEWAGEAFDFVVKYYVSKGLVEAHHYDVNTGDDLLTEKVETEIPQSHLQMKEHGNPKGIVPYYNFSCKYERHGNGYEKKDDLAAECAEIRQVIDTLIQMVSKND